MDATIAPTYVVKTRRIRRARAGAPTAPRGPVTVPTTTSGVAPTTNAELARTLPLRVAAGVRVSAPNWMWVVGGGVIGGLLLGPLGAIGGAVAGMLLTR